jgi:CBS domain-containing protein
MTRVREVMSKDVGVAKLDDTVVEVARRMAEQGIGAMPICNSERRLQGMATDRDIVVKVIAPGKDPNRTTVEEIAQGTEVVTIGADDSLDEALETMKRYKVRRLPVIDGHELVGMISQGDVAQALPDDRIGELVEAISAAP